MAQANLAVVQTEMDKKKKQIDFIDIPQSKFFFYTDHKYDRPTTSEHVLVHLFCSSKTLLVQ